MTINLIICRQNFKIEGKNMGAVIHNKYQSKRNCIYHIINIYTTPNHNYTYIYTYIYIYIYIYIYHLVITQHHQSPLSIQYNFNISSFIIYIYHILITTYNTIPIVLYHNITTSIQLPYILHYYTSSTTLSIS